MDDAAWREHARTWIAQWVERVWGLEVDELDQAEARYFALLSEDCEFEGTHDSEPDRCSVQELIPAWVRFKRLFPRVRMLRADPVEWDEAGRRVQVEFVIGDDQGLEAPGSVWLSFTPEGKVTRLVQEFDAGVVLAAMPPEQAAEIAFGREVSGFEPDGPQEV